MQFRIKSFMQTFRPGAIIYTNITVNYVSFVEGTCKLSLVRYSSSIPLQAILSISKPQKMPTRSENVMKQLNYYVFI